MLDILVMFLVITGSNSHTRDPKTKVKRDLKFDFKCKTLHRKTIYKNSA